MYVIFGIAAFNIDRKTVQSNLMLSQLLYERVIYGF